MFNSLKFELRRACSIIKDHTWMMDYIKVYFRFPLIAEKKIIISKYMIILHCPSPHRHKLMSKGTRSMPSLPLQDTEYKK